MKSKFRRLERRWGNVGERISEDVLSLHNTFTELVKKPTGIFNTMILIKSKDTKGDFQTQCICLTEWQR